MDIAMNESDRKDWADSGNLGLLASEKATRLPNRFMADCFGSMPIQSFR
jgi:hypothetical protein